MSLSRRQFMAKIGGVLIAAALLSSLGEKKGSDTGSKMVKFRRYKALTPGKGLLYEEKMVRVRLTEMEGPGTMTTERAEELWNQ